ncbi:MAG: CvpA family protein [Sphaerochaetaceae bacterium]
MLDFVDWILIAVTCIGGISAAFTGFFEEISRKLGIILGIWLGLIFTSSLMGVVQEGTGLGRFPSAIISYVILFLGIYLFITFLGNVLEKLVDTLSLGFVNSMLGFFLGMIETIIILSMAWLLLSSQSVVSLDGKIADSWIVNNILSKVAMVGKGIIGA